MKIKISDQVTSLNLYLKTAKKKNIIMKNHIISSVRKKTIYSTEILYKIMKKLLNNLLKYFISR